MRTHRAQERTIALTYQTGKTRDEPCPRQPSNGDLAKSSDSILFESTRPASGTPWPAPLCCVRLGHAFRRPVRAPSSRWPAPRTPACCGLCRPGSPAERQNLDPLRAGAPRPGPAPDCPAQAAPLSTPARGLPCLAHEPGGQCRPHRPGWTRPYCRVSCRDQGPEIGSCQRLRGTAPHDAGRLVRNLLERAGRGCRTTPCARCTGTSRTGCRHPPGRAPRARVRPAVPGPSDAARDAVSSALNPPVRGTRALIGGSSP